MSVHYLLAQSLRDAEDTARIDLKWLPDRVSGRMGFRDEAGDFVIPVSDVAVLRGILPSAKLYLGYGWRRLRGVHETIEMHRRIGGTAEEKTA